MPKIKSYKALLKRVKVSGGKKKKKVITKTCGQDHYNARESGNTKRAKRRRNESGRTETQNYKKLIPYNL